MQRGVRLTTKTFIEKAKAVHGDYYDYINVIFSRTKDKVQLLCPKHGEFLQRADVHLEGHGCPKCSPFVKTSFNDFCMRQNKIHNNFFSYIEDSYNGLVPKMRINCPLHGEFTKSPNNHLQGQGCPSCKGRDLLGLYLLRCTDSGLTKIGVTSSLVRRLKELPNTLEIVYWKQNNKAFELEQMLHSKYSMLRQNHPKVFGGRTEFFRLTEEELDNLVQFLLHQ